MRNDHPPVHPLPWLYSPCQEMTAEKVDTAHDFFLELTNSFGNHHASQLHRIAAR